MVANSFKVCKKVTSSVDGDTIEKVLDLEESNVASAGKLKIKTILQKKHQAS